MNISALSRRALLNNLRILCQSSNKPVGSHLPFITLHRQLHYTQGLLQRISSSLQRGIKNVYLVDEAQETDLLPNRQNASNKYTERTHTCGELRLKHVGKRVTLCGWVEFQRMNRFVVIRDGYGHTQLIIDEQDTHTQEILATLPYESIIKVKGTVLSRPKDMVNAREATGEVEIMVDSFEVLNEVKHKLPFNIREFQRAKEALRMQYRYLDMRFPEMQRNMRERSKLLMAMRSFLVNERNFVDVETPTLFKATPGGAQEFIVPTRFPGQFYSLVQSPQQFKQMLMAGAIDRYFQIARCYRDEGSRSDRQPEFTQLDIEMSFTNMDGVMNLVEELLQYSWPEFLPPLARKFARITYKDAMEKYGSDKPDTRYEFLLENCTELLKENDNLISNNFGAYCLIFTEPYLALTKSTMEKLTKMVQKNSEIKFVASKINTVEEWIRRLTRLLGENVLQKLKHTLKLQDNSVIFLAYGNADSVLSVLGLIRLEYIKALEEQGALVKKESMQPLWITDFPLFEPGDTPGSLVSAHHPFTAPDLNDLHLLESSPLKVRAQAYDLVLNGNEVAGGSIRIHDPAQQELVFKMLNIDKSFMQHMLNMLSSGCPPHGGIAIGLDRLLSTILRTPSIRDVIAFPKTFEGRDPLSGAPSPISELDKKLYNIEIVDNKPSKL